MESDVGERNDYRLTLTMQGIATVDGTDVEVKDTSSIVDYLDLSAYWTSILGEVKAYLFDGLVALVDGVSDYGDSSTLGGVMVGGGEGTLAALQKMGDGVLKANDLIGTTSGLGTEYLTEEGKTIVNAVREYANTTSPKKMLIDFADVRDDITVAGVGVLSDWMYDVDKAASKGDVRELSKLIAEPTTELAVGFGVEQAGAKLFSKLIKKADPRKLLRGKKRAPDAPDEHSPEIDYERAIAEDTADFDDLPEGVPLTVQTVARSGIDPAEHYWMQDMARRCKCAFFVRPRPREAIKWAKQGLNAKPLPIKAKSVSDLDVEWLGAKDGTQGLVQIRKPDDPYEKIKEAIKNGRLKGIDDPEIKQINKRYNKLYAEWEARDELITKLNAKNGGKGITIRRYGEEVITKVSNDADGFLIFDFNNKRVYSDIDILHIGKPDGSHVSKELYDEVARELGHGIDGQHFSTANTADLPNREIAESLVREYATAHQRGGEPLLIIQPDVTTKGYVDQFKILDNGIDGSFGDLTNNVAEISFVGGGTQ